MGENPHPAFLHDRLFRDRDGLARDGRTSIYSRSGCPPRGWSTTGGRPSEIVPYKGAVGGERLPADVFAAGQEAVGEVLSELCVR